MLLLHLVCDMTSQGKTDVKKMQPNRRRDDVCRSCSGVCRSLLDVSSAWLAPLFGSWHRIGAGDLPPSM